MLAKPLYKNIVEQQAVGLLGLQHQTIGKTQARQQFLPLVSELEYSAKTIEITDHQQPVAVLVSYSHWAALISKLAMLTKPAPLPKIDLIGSVKIIGNLEVASKKIGQRFRKSVKRSAKSL